MLAVSGKRTIMNFRAAKSLIKINTITLKREHKIVMRHNFNCKISVIRIICKPNGCLNSASPKNGDLLKR
ncbi:hypothetical protein D3C76_1384040 [compost metagenome]